MPHWQMNWTRGLFRLWVVGSIAWAAVVPIVMLDAINQKKRARGSFEDLVPLTNVQLAQLAFSAIVPPVLVMLTFFVIRWVARGFR